MSQEYKKPNVSQSPESSLVDGLTEANDLIVLEEQLSADEIVLNADIIHTEKLIEESRSLDRQPPFVIDIFGILKKAAINLVLPFINGMMLGFGEILAHEIGFRYNWSGARVEPPRRLEQKRRETSSKYL
ncbi:Mitochondrial import protein 1 [Candida viswanathii]|uniref:Mitochondrial import protein 1 n=1 Tax=Candida viswanathii TaxID=5486 RepID=A0A367YCU7_9ASCO|nr:Mitochondrial import protein 1 [Candida viswanathii]